VLADADAVLEIRVEAPLVGKFVASKKLSEILMQDGPAAGGPAPNGPH
jgi:hypothetical protein